MTDLHDHDDLGDIPERDAPAGAAWHNAHRILLVVSAVALVLWLFSGVYNVGAREEAIVERLGEYLTTPDGQQIVTVGPGLHVGLPWPLDRVEKVARRESHKMDVTTFDASPASVETTRTKLAQRQVGEEFINEICFPYIITADKNIVHTAVTLYYTIDDIEAYVKAVADEPGQNRSQREDMLRKIVERQVIVVLGSHSIESILYRQDTSIDDELKARLKGALKTASGESMLGISIDSIRLSLPRVPDKVKPSFDAAFNAVSARQSQKELAAAQANSDRFQGKVEADARIADAKNYKMRVVLTAEAEKARFTKSLEFARLDPEVARFNLWQVTIKEMLKNAQHVYTVENGQNFILPIERQQRLVDSSQQGGGG